MSPTLCIVPGGAGGSPMAGGPSLSLAQRIRNLQAEAQALGQQQVTALLEGIADLERLAAEVVDAGPLHAPGIREEARQLAEELFARGQTLTAIAQRT